MRSGADRWLAEARAAAAPACHTDLIDGRQPQETTSVATYDREQIRAALVLSDPAVSSFLDLETGSVVRLTEGDDSPENQRLSDEVMASIGDRFRYISGGNPAAADADVSAWLENEGL
jgi:hypothetical protein